MRSVVRVVVGVIIVRLKFGAVQIAKLKGGGFVLHDGLNQSFAVRLDVVMFCLLFVQFVWVRWFVSSCVVDVSNGGRCLR